MALRSSIFEQFVLTSMMGFTSRISGAVPPTTSVLPSWSRLANAK